jgi:hypothetical protein
MSPKAFLFILHSLDECYQIEKGIVTEMKNAFLGVTGYRLPTEAEMEYGIRAGAQTPRYYGEAEELLPKYAWYHSNSQERAWPVGFSYRKLPVILRLSLFFLALTAGMITLQKISARLHPGRPRTGR